LAKNNGKVKIDNKIHQAKSAAPESQNLHLAASSAKVISAQFFLPDRLSLLNRGK
jgi:hypothetical protein